MITLLLITSILLAVSGLANIYQARRTQFLLDRQPEYDALLEEACKDAVKLSEALQTIELLNLDMEDFEGSHDDLHAMYDELETERNELLEVNEELAEQFKYADKKCLEFMDTMREYESQIDQWRDIANSLENERDEWRTKYEALDERAEQEVDQAWSERDKEGRKVLSLYGELRQMADRCDDWRTKAEKLQADKAAQEQEHDLSFAQMADRLDHVNLKSRAQIQTIRQLNEKIDELRQSKKRLWGIVYNKRAVINELEWLLYIDAGYGHEAEVMADIAEVINKKDPLLFANDWHDMINRIEVSIGTYGRLIVYKSSPYHTYCQHVNGPVQRIPASQMTPALKKAQALAQRAIKSERMTNAK